MKKSTIFKIATTSALVLTVSSVSFNIKKGRQYKRDQSPFSKLSRMSVNLNKAFAVPAINHQQIYDAAKNEINMEVKDVVDAINSFLTAANVTSCATIPAPNLTEFYTTGVYDLYSTTVPAHNFALAASLPGVAVTWTHMLELKLTTGNTALGKLYIDCNSGAAEVRYLGKLDTPQTGDTNLAIAYYEDPATGYETILLASDYNAGTGYPAGKLAVHYSESASSQSVAYGYAENGSATEGYTGTLTATTAGVATSATATAPTGNVLTDLTSLTGVAAYGISNINGMTISL